MNSPGPHPFPVSTAERERIDQIDRAFTAGADAVPGLMAALGDPSWAVRRAVISALAALGDDALPALLDSLVAPRADETILAAIVEALVVSTGAVEAVIAPLARHSDPAVAADVAQVLGRRRKPEAVPPLIRLASHPNDNVAVTAIEALGRVGSRAAVEALLATLASGNFYRVFPAIDVLGRSGDPRVVQPLAELLAERHYALEAVRALGRTGDKAAVPPLAGRLVGTSSVSDVRVAAQALVQLADEYGVRYGQTVPVRELLRRSVNPRAAARRVVQAASGADADERAALCTLLGLLGDEEAMQFLVPLVATPDPVGTAATKALHELGRGSELVVLGALKEARGEGRKALLALVTAPTALREVVACLSDPDADVRAAACEALGRMGAPEGLSSLFGRLADTSPLVVQSAISAIQSVGGPDTRGLAMANARSPNVAVRRWSLRILSYFGFPGTLEVLLEAINDDDPRVQESAIQGLAFIEEPSAKDALLAATRHPSASVRAVGLRSLGQTVPDVRVEAALIRGLSDPEPWPRYYASQSAGKLRVEAAIDTLVRLLADPAGQVRVAAIEALSHFEGPVAEAALVERASSNEDDLRQAALIGLGIAHAGLPAVMNAVGSAEAATRLVAVSALASFETPEVTALLLRAGTDADESVRTAAIGALASRPGPGATAALVSLLGSDKSNAALIREALAIPSPDRVAGLAQALAAAHDELAPLLTAALARMRTPEATAALIDLLGRGSESARKAAAVTLGGVGTSETLTALRAAVTDDPSVEVRRICAAILNSPLDPPPGNGSAPVPGLA